MCFLRFVDDEVGFDVDSPSDCPPSFAELVFSVAEVSVFVPIDDDVPVVFVEVLLVVVVVEVAANKDRSDDFLAGFLKNVLIWNCHRFALASRNFWNRPYYVVSVR